MHLGKSIILGIEEAPQVVEVNGRNVTFQYDKANEQLIISNMNVAMYLPIKITWR